MTLARGRVLKAGVDVTASTAVPVAGAGGVPKGRLVRAIVVEAAAEAGRVIEAARERARAIVAEADRAAEGAKARAVEDGRAEGAAAVAAAWISLRKEQDRAAERALDHTVALARLLAERLLGEELVVDASRIGLIARQALAQARRARRVVVTAHPDDASALSADPSRLGLEEASIEIVADLGRARGSLRLETDLGTLDADLAPQLDRLARALRDGLDPQR